MHPVFLQIGDFVIGTYGVMIVVGLLAALWLVTRLARRRGMNPDFFYDLVFVTMLSGFVGARLFYIGQNWEAFVENPRGLIFSREGFVFLGGLFAAVFVTVLFALKRRMPLLEVADVMAPGLVLGHAFGRIGCFFAGCCHGVACPPGDPHILLGKIAVPYPVLRNADGSLNEMFNYAYGSQVMEGLSPAATHTWPMVPVQLFESFGNFMICLGLLWLWRRRKFSGEIAAAYLIAYSVLRFGLEYLRGDTVRGVYFEGLLSTSQIISIGTLIAGVAFWIWRKDKGIQEIPAAAQTQTDENKSPENPPPPAPNGKRKRRGANPGAPRP